MKLSHVSVIIYIVISEYIVAPNIITPPKNHATKKQSNVTFTCVAAAYPRAVIQWIKDGKVLNNSSNNTAVKHIIVHETYGDCNITNLPNGCLVSSNLTIIKIDSSDEGGYVCKATNDVGNSTKNATLTVQGMYLCRY